MAFLEDRDINQCNRIAALEAENAHWRAVAEDSARQCAKLRSACELALAIAESRGTWGDLMRVLRAALAPEEEQR
jgi:hypothetical protein